MKEPKPAAKTIDKQEEDKGIAEGDVRLSVESANEDDDLNPEGDHVPNPPPQDSITEPQTK